MNQISKEVEKVLICGLGSIGRRHLKLIKEHWPSVNVSSLRSNKPEFYKNKVSEIEGVYKYFYNVKDAKDWEPDCVFISNPASFHLKNALLFADSSTHIFIEKPIGTGDESSYEWQKLLEYNKKNKILVGYVFRHDLGIKKLKEEIKDLGQIIEADFYCGSWLPNWRIALGIDYRNSVSAKSTLGGGALLELSHEIDLAYWLLGPLNLKYSFLSKSNNLEIDVEDKVLIHAINNYDCNVTLRLNFCTKDESRLINIKGLKGSIEYDLNTSKMIITKNNISKEIYDINESKDMKYISQISHFFDCIKYNKPPLCSLEDGLKVLKYIKIAKEINSNPL